MPEATVYATSTALPGTNQQRKRYHIILKDEETQIRFILVVGPDGSLRVEPFVEHEIDYDEWDDPEAVYESLLELGYSDTDARRWAHL